MQDVNKRNFHIWRKALTEALQELPMYTEKCSDLCELWEGGIIGLYFSILGLSIEA